MKRKTLQKSDVILIAVLLAAALAALGARHWTSPPLQAVIYSGGQEFRRIDLAKVKEPYLIELDTDPKVTIRVEPGKIRYLSAGCPDKLCVKAGVLSRRGDTAVCLPSGTAVVIEGTRMENSSVDVITY